MGVITEHGEFGPPGAQGSLSGLALIGGIIRELGICDLQVVLPSIRRAHDPVPWPGCRDRKGKTRVRPVLGLDHLSSTQDSSPSQTLPKAGPHLFQASSPPVALSWALPTDETVNIRHKLPSAGTIKQEGMMKEREGEEGKEGGREEQMKSLTGHLCVAQKASSPLTMKGE